MMNLDKEFSNDKRLEIEDKGEGWFKRFLQPAQSRNMVDRYALTIIGSLMVWSNLRKWIECILERIIGILSFLEIELLDFKIIKGLYTFLQKILTKEEGLGVISYVITFLALIVVTVAIPHIFNKHAIVNIKFGFFFFEYDSYYKKKFLKEKCKKYRKIVGIFITLISAAQIPLNIWKLDLLERLFLIYLLILVYRIFSGYTKSEYEEKFINAKERSIQKKIKDYSEKIDEVNHDFFVLQNRISAEHLPEIQKQFQFKGKEKRFLYNNSESIDHLELMERILKDESVLTDTPFYKDLGIALFLPLHNALLKGKKIIFFSGGSEGREEITDWIQKGIKSITKMKECWKIVNVVEQEKPWDIGVITPDDMRMLYDIKESLQNQFGFIIVMLHPERILLEAQNELYEWGYLLSRQNVAPVYVIIERAMLGLLDLVSHVFRTEFKYISKAAEPASVTSTYVVDCERRDVYQKEMRITPNIAIEGMLAIFAENAGFAETYWMAGDKMAVYDLNSIKKQHPRKDITQIAVEEVKCKAGLWGIPKEVTSILIMPDEINNIWELLRQAKTRGIDVSIISIVSNRYLLLPYMLYNIDIFKNDLYAIPAMAVDITELSLNRSVILLKMLVYSQMTGEEIRSYRSIYNPEKNEGPCLTEDEIQHIQAEIGGHIDCSIEIEQREDGWYYIRETPEIKSVCKEINSPAYYFDEEEQTKTFIGGKHVWQLDQNYLPGQTVTLSGKLYRVQGKEDVFLEKEKEWQTVLRVKRYRSGLIYFQKYYQDRKYLVEQEISIEEYQEQRFGINWQMLTVSFTVETRGYYMIRGFECDTKVEHTQLEEQQRRNVFRSYENQGNRKNAIVLKFDRTLSWKQKRVLVIILNEVLKTLFPEGHQYIAVLAVMKDGTYTEQLKHLYYDFCGSSEDKYDILILEDCQFELGILRMINKHMEHIFRIVYSYCKWWNKEIQSVTNPELTIMGKTIVPFHVWKKVMQDTRKITKLFDTENLRVLDEYRTEHTS